MGLKFLKSLSIKSLALKAARAIIKKHGHEIEQKAIAVALDKLNPLMKKIEPYVTQDENDAA